MSKVFWQTVAILAVLGMSVSQASARGGHGGGHHGGGHHGGAHHSGHHEAGHAGDHAHHGDYQHYHHSDWARHNRPFSRGWYARHGGYGWGGWGWGNPWAISTFGATAAWLGLEAAEPRYGNYGTVENVLTSDTEDESANDDGSNEATSADTGVGENDLASDPAQANSAMALANSGKTDPPRNTAFLPLGVFSLAPRGQREASALVQLSVSKNGLLRGTYFDLSNDHDQPIWGAVDKQSQQVAFGFGQDTNGVFETSLANLTHENGGAGAYFENGQAATWTIARYEKEPLGEDGTQPAPLNGALDAESHVAPE